MGAKVGCTPIKILYIQLLEYIIVAGDSESFKGFFKVLAKQSIKYRSDTMNIAQRLQNEGRKEGIKEGKREGMEQVAFKMRDVLETP